MVVCSGCLLAFKFGQDAHQYLEVWPPLVVTVPPWDGDLQAILLVRQEIPKVIPGCTAAEDPIKAI